MNFEGETGPYCQYTYARCSSILKKNPDFDENVAIDASLITDPASTELIKQIYKFPAVVKDAAERFEPCAISRFTVDTAQAFNKFYTENRINVDDKNLRDARCMLVSITRKTIHDALALLGGDTVEEM